MLLLYKKSLMIAVLAMSLAPLSQAQRRGWELLGERTVDGVADHDVIPVTRAEGRFRAIQMRVLDGTVDLNRIVVHYGNGSSEVFSMHDRIRAGGSTRALDLPGE